MPEKPPKSGRRTREQLREHYEIEKELADRLRNAPKEQRRYLYSELYNELFRRVPLHPQLAQKASPEQTKQAIAAQMQLLKRFLFDNLTFLEIGPGDCALSFEVCKRARQVFAVDVSEEITATLTPPQNFQLILSDGCSIPLPANSVDLAYSNQLMEHLHPDDAFEQLQNIYNVLSPGGRYLCVTPNRYLGPSDISKYFDQVATGFHLKEYSVGELSDLFKKAGFSEVKIACGGRGKYVILPSALIVLCEAVLSLFPYKLRKAITSNILFSGLLGIRIIGIKK